MADQSILKSAVLPASPMPLFIEKKVIVMWSGGEMGKTLIVLSPNWPSPKVKEKIKKLKQPKSGKRSQYNTMVMVWLQPKSSCASFSNSHWFVAVIRQFQMIREVEMTNDMSHTKKRDITVLHKMLQNAAIWFKIPYYEHHWWRSHSFASWPL